MTDHGWEMERTVLNAKTRIIDVIDDPLFEDYGRLIFPTAFERPSASMTLADAGSMLIYHNDIRTDTTIDVISEM